MVTPFLSFPLSLSLTKLQLIQEFWKSQRTLWADQTNFTLRKGKLPKNRIENGTQNQLILPKLQIDWDEEGGERKQRDRASAAKGRG